MWGSLLGLALLVGFNPVLLAVILLMISRPRPLQNLLAYLVGGLIVNLMCVLVPLVVLQSTPTFTSFARDSTIPASAASSTVRHIQLGIGVVALAVAALLTMRSAARQRAQPAKREGNTSVLVLDSDRPTEFSPLGLPQGAATEGGSPMRRVLGRLQAAWESGSLWVAFVFGIGGLPPPLLVLFVDAMIVASGAPIGTQVVAAIAFVIGMFAVIEITLVSYLVAPAKTQAILRPLHNWALAHRRQVVIAILAVVGLLQVSKGLGIF
ncbi:GAP family protein [Mycobacterium celatum]|uniref:GAP family protein n=1 Tax=Mycobacterium celatum TaxID=28045 RepID=A0A1X1RQG5_MYCCE|nr:GAP family protein [Mycobacterium celatum]ORV12526.1 gap protein [Mycobacterium celatum]PIB74596.1 GAP family protein [Mycobacterium celatum]